MQNLCGLEWATGALEGKWIEFGLTKTLQFDKYITVTLSKAAWESHLIVLYIFKFKIINDL